ncbi:hypothetical protein [Gordonia crocea]|uniref:hypothetical protein n=1 Tax=Gordonia crocea TaxID=589162 RepID=UPI00137ACAD1|nr:hypothetical protein [Gordonia crocea]
MPAEEISDLSSDTVGRRILQTFEAEGQTKLLCLTTRDLGADDREQAVIAPVSEIERWWKEHSFIDTVIASPDLDSAVLLTVDEFLLVGGDRSFVEAVLGKPLDAARAEFTEYAEDMANASRHLPGIAQKWCADH